MQNYNKRKEYLEQTVKKKSRTDVSNRKKEYDFYKKPLTE